MSNTFKPFPPMRDDESTVIDSKQARELNDLIERLTKENLKLTAKHGPADSDEVEHYESCECCQNFHRMEQQHDKVQAVGKRLAFEKGDLRVTCRVVMEHLKANSGDKNMIDRLEEILTITDSSRPGVEQAVGDGK